MKSMKITAAALAATVAFAGIAQAATATGTATANVIGSLTITQTAPLNFGSFSAGTTAGTITNFGVVTGGVSAISAGGSAFFTVTGNPNSSFFITVPASVNLTNGANTMTATLSGPTSSALDNTGSRVFNVTGTLAVAANQVAGAYNGTYTVTANY